MLRSLFILFLALVPAMANDSSYVDAKTTPFANRTGELTNKDYDLIKRQISENWAVPAEMTRGKDLTLTLKLDMNPDGSVRTVEVIETSKSQGLASMRALVESAKRAVYKADPFKLSSDYDQWKTITIGFNPQNML